MAKGNIKSKQGFTIIEVVLVLAIAGLIFLMVFVALPALQRSQRDTARRNDLARVDTSLVQYQTNNQGTHNGSNLPQPDSWPTASSTFDDGCKSNSACTFVRNYMNSGTDTTTNTFQDPDGTYYGMQIIDFSKTAYPNGFNYVNEKGSQMDHVVYVLNGAQCNGEVAVESTARHFAIVYRLEGAGTYCIDDQ